MIAGIMDAVWMSQCIHSGFSNEVLAKKIFLSYILKMVLLKTIYLHMCLRCVCAYRITIKDLNGKFLEL